MEEKKDSPNNPTVYTDRSGKRSTGGASDRAIAAPAYEELRESSAIREGEGVYRNAAEPRSESIQR